MQKFNDLNSEKNVLKDFSYGKNIETIKIKSMY